MFGTMTAAIRVAEDRINFVETSGQRRPDEDMLREEERFIHSKSLKCAPGKQASTYSPIPIISRVLVFL